MNVVLVEPEIHFNTGNIARTCIGAGAALHLVGQLGFSLEDKHLRRSGLDYWPLVDLRLHKSFADFLKSVPADASLLFFSAEADKDYWDASYREDSYLVFGKESVGLSAQIRDRYRDSLYCIPHLRRIRSLNLSTAAGIVLYEAVRQTISKSLAPRA